MNADVLSLRLLQDRLKKTEAERDEWRELCFKHFQHVEYIMQRYIDMLKVEEDDDGNIHMG